MRIQTLAVLSAVAILISACGTGADPSVVAEPTTPATEHLEEPSSAASEATSEQPDSYWDPQRLAALQASKEGYEPPERQDTPSTTVHASGSSTTSPSNSVPSQQAPATAEQPPAPTEEAPVVHSVSGYVIYPLVPGPTTCAFPEVVPPAQIVVTDGAGSILAATNVGAAANPWDPSTGSCEYPYQIELPDNSLYVFTLDEDDPLVVTREELASKNGRLGIISWSGCEGQGIPGCD